VIISIAHSGQTYTADLSKGISIAMPLSNDSKIACFHAPPFTASPLVSGDFVGSVKQGSPVNFFNVSFNPHGNGTHTECLGHITKEQQSIFKELNQSHFIASVNSIQPSKDGDDFIIHPKDLEHVDWQRAMIFRTLPNTEKKLQTNYNNSNPPYFSVPAIELIVSKGVEHILIDLPSVDKEKDEGLVAGHKAYWNYPSLERRHCTITELIYVPNSINDGNYLLDIQIAPMLLDASPSNPVIYKLNLS